MKKIIFLTLASVVFHHWSFGQSGVSAFDPEPENRHQAYLQLNRQIYARHEDPGSGNLNLDQEKGKSTIRQLNQMVQREVGLALAADKPTAKTIISAISTLQGEITLSAWGPEETNTPFAQFLSLNGTQTVAIAYVLMQEDDAIPDTQPYLKFYDNSSGVWAEKASSPTLADFEAGTFSVAQLKSGNPGEAWFLAWGMPFGSSRGSVHICLYSFDGSAVRTLWKRDRLNGGKVTATPDAVTLDYLDRNDMSIERHEVFQVTPNGLQQTESVTKSAQ